MMIGNPPEESLYSLELQRTGGGRRIEPFDPYHQLVSVVFRVARHFGTRCAKRATAQKSTAAKLTKRAAVKRPSAGRALVPSPTEALMSSAFDTTRSSVSKMAFSLGWSSALLGGGGDGVGVGEGALVVGGRVPRGCLL